MIADRFTRPETQWNRRFYTRRQDGTPVIMRKGWRAVGACLRRHGYGSYLAGDAAEVRPRERSIVVVGSCGVVVVQFK